MMGNEDRQPAAVSIKCCNVERIGRIDWSIDNLLKECGGAIYMPTRSMLIAPTKLTPSYKHVQSRENKSSAVWKATNRSSPVGTRSPGVANT